MQVAEKFNGKQLAALGGILLMLILIIFVGVNIGMAALSVAAILLLFRVADDNVCIKAMPWNTIIMVLCGRSAEHRGSHGRHLLMTDALASVMNSSAPHR